MKSRRTQPISEIILVEEDIPKIEVFQLIQCILDNGFELKVVDKDSDMYGITDLLGKMIIWTPSTYVRKCNGMIYLKEDERGKQSNKLLSLKQITSYIRRIRKT